MGGVAGGLRRRLGVNLGVVCVAAGLAGGLAAAPVATADVWTEPEGAWFDLGGKYIKGDQSYGIVVCYYADGQEAVRTVALDEVGVGYVFEENVLSRAFRREARSRSRAFSCGGVAAAINSSLLSEGAHTYRSLAWGTLGGPESASDSWTVSIDRTPPVTPHGFEVATADRGSGAATIEWAPSADATLADGSPGSGVALVQARYSINGGAFSAWAPANADEISLVAQPGDSVTVQVLVTDNLGWVSAVGSATLVPFGEIIPPSAPSGLTANLDPIRDRAQLYWTSGVDPQPGSGAVADEWRIRQLDGTLSEWDEVAIGEPAFVNRDIGDQVELQVRTLDAAGNTSATASATLTVGSATPPFWGEFVDCPDTSKLPDEDVYYDCVTEPGEAPPGLLGRASDDPIDYPSGQTLPPASDDFHWGFAGVTNLYKGRRDKNPPPVARIFEELRSSFHGTRLNIKMWSVRFGPGYPEYNPRWRINVRAADGALRRAGPYFESSNDDGFGFWTDHFDAEDNPRHRTNSTYYFNWGRSYLLPAPLLNPNSSDGRYHVGAHRSARYFCNQSQERCTFL